MGAAAYACVDRKRFRARLAEMTRKARQDLAEFMAEIKTGPVAFASYAPDVIETNAWIETLNQVSRAKPGTTVETIQAFALREVLRIAEGRHANGNELRAWARIVDLTRLGSMQSAL